MSDSDLLMARVVLAEAGLDENAIRETLALDPQLPYSREMKEKIEAKRTQLKDEARQKMLDEWAASPEGRKAAALEARKAAQERAELVEGARELLGLEEGDDLSEDEILDYAGIVPGPVTQERQWRENDERLANDLEANLARANDDLTEGTDS